MYAYARGYGYLCSKYQENPQTQMRGEPFSVPSICDGIVFVKPVSEFNGIHLINIYDEEFIEKANKRTKGSCKTAEDILKTVKEWHPILKF